MKLSEFSHTVTSRFKEVYRFRVQEWALIEPGRLNESTTGINFQIFLHCLLIY
jgi:hypothetical protein